MTEFDLTTDDERTHRPDPDPTWRESFWFDVVDDETGVGLLAYAGVQPGEGTGYCLVHLADGDDVRYQYRNYAVPVTEHAEGRTETTIGPMNVVIDPDTGATRLRFAADGWSADVAFTPTAVSYDYPWEWTRSRHYEQLGTATATITGPDPDAAPIVLRGRAARDHAWGLRSLRHWLGWLWITSRAVDGGPSWTVCWVKDSEYTQVFGHVVEESGDVHRITGLVAELDYDGELPQGARLTLTAENRAPLAVKLAVNGLADLSHADAAKRGGYYFSFQSGDTDGHRSTGTFDVFWRDGLAPWSRIEAAGLTST